MDKINVDACPKYTFTGDGGDKYGRSNKLWENMLQVEGNTIKMKKWKQEVSPNFWNSCLAMHYQNKYWNKVS